MSNTRRDFLGGFGAGLMASMLPLSATTPFQPTGYIRTNWGQDPFARGSYSYLARGSSQTDRSKLEAPMNDRIFFAGEAVFPSHNSTVHAAHESGVRTARMIKRGKAAKVAIIGAGMAGLSAAHHLAGSGRDVTVFEARNRIGGRIWSDGTLGVPLDLGASWIHAPRGNPVAGLARSAGAKTLATGADYVIRGSDARQIRDRDAPDWLDEVAEIEQEYAADLDDLHPQYDAWNDDYAGTDVVFPGGYQAVFGALAGDYAVQLSSTVQQIRMRDNDVEVALRGGRRNVFDAVLVTLPLGVLKRGDVRFSPPLPGPKKAAIQRLGMGLLDKVYLRYDRPFWDDKTWILTPETGLGRGQFNQWLNLNKVVGVPVIMAFNAASAARTLSKMSDARIVKLAGDVLERAYAV